MSRPNYREWFVPKEKQDLKERVKNLERVVSELLRHLKLNVVVDEPFDSESFISLEKEPKRKDKF